MGTAEATGKSQKKAVTLPTSQSHYWIPSPELGTQELLQAENVGL